MPFSRMQSRHRGAARLLIFVMLTPILFRVLYGVPPVPSGYVVNPVTSTIERAIPTHAKSLTFDAIHASANFADIKHPESLKITAPKNAPLQSQKKRLAPIKTFKSKLIPKTIFDPSNLFDPATLKTDSIVIQHISPSLGKRYLSTHSNAPPVIK